MPKVLWLQDQAIAKDRLNRLKRPGAFETCRVKKGKVQFLKAHWKRLCASLKTLGITVADTREILERLQHEATSIDDGYMRIGALGRNRLQWIIHKKEGLPYTQAQREEGVVVRTVPTRWPLGDPAVAQAKGAERLSGIMARTEGGPAVEMLRINQHGLLTEGTISNFFCVKAGALLTSPTFVGALEGVTRTKVIALGKRLKMRVQEVPLTRHDLFNADEAFLTNVLMGILPIREVDARQIGKQVPGRVTQKLLSQWKRYL